MINFYSIKEVVKFLNYACEKGFLPAAKVCGYKTAFKKLLSKLPPEELTLQNLEDNLDSIKGQYRNLHKDLTCYTIDEYGRRILQAIDHYRCWKANPVTWEKMASEKAYKISKVGLPCANGNNSIETEIIEQSQDFRMVKIPLRQGFDVIITVPQDLLTAEEYLKIGVGLLTFCKNFVISATQWPRPVTQ